MPDYSLHCLDVGAIEYGDSVLGQFPGHTILIDGGARKSGTATQSVVAGEDIAHQPLDAQIRALLTQPTAAVDLLVVTHCHADHIGCLPELLSSGRLTCKWALVADPQYGFGITGDSDELPSPARMSAHDKVWLALREEPPFGATDAELHAFIEDAAREYQQYVAMVNGLVDALGSKCVLYRGADSPGLDGLLTEFAPTGLKIYGPNDEHLVACAEFLVGRSEDSLPAAIADDATSLVAAYRAALETLRSADAEDSVPGAAVNCQSLVVAVGSGTTRALLTGDMQFARPELSAEVSTHVKQLAAAIKADAPFGFVKLSHHGATNGQNLTLLTDWGAKRMAISTGARSSKHPTGPTLQALTALGGNPEWARVDMNGRCTYQVRNGRGTLKVERNELNDLTAAADRAGDMAPPNAVAAAGIATTTATATVQTSAGVIEIPLTLRIQVSIDVGPPKASTNPNEPRLSTPPDTRDGRGRLVPGLLFITDSETLKARLGPRSDEVLRWLAQQQLPFVDARRRLLVNATRAALMRHGDKVSGVVIVGGYEVVPSHILNALPSNLRGTRVPDRDLLQVWNDDAYGDRDGDGLPELPVSRVPDAGDVDFLLRCLQAPALKSLSSRAGVRNQLRPFAQAVFDVFPGQTALIACDPDIPSPRPFSLQGDLLYLMLHGHADDATVFAGETSGGTYPSGVELAAIPSPAPGVVFAGCCYGALIVDEPAVAANPAGRVTSRGLNQSIALKCLANGSNAFIGCTAVHYSPGRPPFTYFGQPLHLGFAQYLKSGVPAARALWQAKVDYAHGIPHRPGSSAAEVAYEHKILRQFTCLGLGW